MIPFILLCFVATCAHAQLLINEIHPTPSGGEPEWIECINIGTRSINLNTWMICDSRSCVTLDDVMIPARGFVVLTRDAVALHESRWIPHNVVVFEAKLPSLNNTTDRVEIRNADSVLIDSMSYDARRHVRGRSIERVGESWASCVARDSATCGAMNSVVTLERDVRCAQISALDDQIVIDVVNHGRTVLEATQIFIEVGGEKIRFTTSTLDPGMAWSLRLPIHTLRLYRQLRYERVLAYAEIDDDRAENDSVEADLMFPPLYGTLMINEVLADPLQGSCEYVEVWNGTTDTIDLDGWIIEDASHVRSVGIGKTVVAPNGYGVIAGDTSIRNRIGQDRWTLARPALQINSTTDLIVLRTPSGFLVDSMTYDEKLHHPIIPTTKGVALEKRNAIVVSSDRSAWTSSGDVSGGTPGRSNSVSIEASRSGKMQAVPSPFSSDPGRRISSCVITWQQPFEQAIARVCVYRPDGSFVADLLNTVFIAREGGVAWSGVDWLGQRVAVGPYVVALECVDASSAAVYRDRCLVVVGE